MKMCKIYQLECLLKPINGVWWSKNITRNRKKMIYNSMVRNVLIYGAETCSLYEDDRRRINATEVNALTLRVLMSYIYIYIYNIRSVRVNDLSVILLTWRKW
jgi:uncharacterized membrane protein